MWVFSTYNSISMRLPSWDWPLPLAEILGVEEGGSPCKVGWPLPLPLPLPLDNAKVVCGVWWGVEVCKMLYSLKISIRINVISVIGRVLKLTGSASIVDWGVYVWPWELGPPPPCTYHNKIVNIREMSYF
jgi:hypothetical protein